MKKIFYILTIFTLLTSCKEEKRLVEKIDFITEYKFSSAIEKEVANTKDYQRSATDYSLKGDYQNALKHWDMAFANKPKTYSKKQIDSINLKYKVIPAIDYIIKESKNSQVLIINEAHHNSYHRVFTKSLLQKLYDNGYKNFGLEALTSNDSLNYILNNRKYPIQKIGYYTKDPQFGSLLRDAISIGFNLFAYEYFDEGSGKPREIGQAKNIQKVINSKPNEKFLIHCGFAHVLEGEYKSWEKTMAGRLTEYTGINPLTINQTKYSERSRPKLNHPFLKALNIEESSILIDKKDNPLKYERGEAYADIAVFHPNTKYFNNRPDWIFEDGNKNVTVYLTDIDIEFPVMVLAFKKGEDINDAIPLDITELTSKTDYCHLGLKKGFYEIVVTNGAESFKFEQKVK